MVQKNNECHGGGVHVSNSYAVEYTSSSYCKEHSQCNDGSISVHKGKTVGLSSFLPSWYSVE